MSRVPQWREPNLARLQPAPTQPNDGACGAEPQATNHILPSLRKGFNTGLIAAGANREAVEFLLGHSMGLRGVYTDPSALRLRESIRCVPARIFQFGAAEPGANRQV